MSNISEMEKREGIERMEKAKTDFEKLMEEVRPFVKGKKTTKSVVSEAWKNQEDILHLSLDK